MAQAYFNQGLHEKPARFEHFFRENPNYGDHRAGYCVNAGLNTFLDWLKGAEPTTDDINYLRDLSGSSGSRLFGTEFLDWLSNRDPFSELTVRAVPEGRIVHPNEPVTVVEGPLALAQLVETPLLNHINYQILIATRAARIAAAGEGKLLLEFGMRRAHEKGGNSGARAAMIGGADFSSNTAASRMLGYPPKGTHAHSFVQAYLALGKSELEAFQAFARAYPDDCILLVDTVDTLHSGVPNAIEVFKELRAEGHEPVGIRLDSGDLAHLAVRSAKLLNEAGFPEVSIVLSNQLDELVLRQILEQIRSEAPDYGLELEALIERLVYGVGTRLITSAGDSSLGGVYKLVAIKKGRDWKPVLKLSETPEKVPIPGRKNLYRLYDYRGRATADLLTAPEEEVHEQRSLFLQHPYREQSWRELSPEDIGEVEPLLATYLCEGKLLREGETMEKFRERCQNDLQRLAPGVKRVLNPHYYHVSLSSKIWELKQDLVQGYGN